MPQDSALYGVARIRSRERTLLNRERMQRLSESTPAEALRQLIEIGYGAMPEATLDDVEAMIASELNRAYELIREVSVKPEQTDLFLMGADVHNLKLLLKLRLTGSNAEPTVERGGLYDPKALAKMVDTGEYKDLPEEFRVALERLEQGFARGQVNPSGVSTALDNAYLAYALQKGDAFTQTYFKAQADFNNLIALLRVRALGGDAERLSALLLEGGDIPREILLKNFDTPTEGLARAATAGPMADAMAKGLEEVARTGRVSALEKARDDALMAFASKGKNDVDTMAPIMGFLLAKGQEARCVRLVMTALRNGLGEDVISERMRVLYGE